MLFCQGYIKVRVSANMCLAWGVCSLVRGYECCWRACQPLLHHQSLRSQPSCMSIVQIAHRALACFPRPTATPFRSSLIKAPLSVCSLPVFPSLSPVGSVLHGDVRHGRQRAHPHGGVPQRQEARRKELQVRHGRGREERERGQGRGGWNQLNREMYAPLGLARYVVAFFQAAHGAPRPLLSRRSHYALSSTALVFRVVCLLATLPPTSVYPTPHTPSQKSTPTPTPTPRYLLPGEYTQMAGGCGHACCASLCLPSATACFWGTLNL